MLQLAIYEQFCTGVGASARMLSCYIEEAHAKDEWYFKNSQVTTKFKTEIMVHKNIGSFIQLPILLKIMNIVSKTQFPNIFSSIFFSKEERIAAAKLFQESTEARKLDVVCDSMVGHAVTRYGAWPERLYIIVDGIVVYQGGMGPFGYRLDEVRGWLESKQNGEIKAF